MFFEQIVIRTKANHVSSVRETGILESLVHGEGLAEAAFAGNHQGSRSAISDHVHEVRQEIETLVDAKTIDLFGLARGFVHGGFTDFANVGNLQSICLGAATGLDVTDHVVLVGRSSQNLSCVGRGPLASARFEGENCNIRHLKVP